MTDCPDHSLIHRLSTRMEFHLQRMLRTSTGRREHPWPYFGLNIRRAKPSVGNRCSENQSSESSLVAIGDEVEADDPEDDHRDKQEAKARRRFIEQDHTKRDGAHGTDPRPDGIRGPNW